MARKILLKESGLNDSQPAPAGYKYIGYSDSIFSEKSTATVSMIASDKQTISVTISSSQILNMSSSPIQLLPTLGVNQYYVIEEVIIEYTYVSTQYTFTDSIALKSV